MTLSTPLLWSPELYQEAWDFATIAHHGQTYATPIEGLRIDYINHVGAVVMEVMWALAHTNDVSYDGNLAVGCAMLHDVLEDTAHTYAELQAQFGQAIATGVLALTKQADLPRSEQMRDSIARIRQQPQAVWLVKLADRINNLSEPPFHWSTERIAAYWQESQFIYEQLHTANALLAQRLAEKIQAYQGYLSR